MGEGEKALAPRTPDMGAHGVQLRSMDDARTFCQWVLQSGLAPASYKKAEQIFVAVQTGLEAGLTPMASLRSIYVVSGMPSWSGKAAVALIRASGVCERWEETKIEGEGDNRVAIQRSKRADQPDSYETRFSVADAKKAKLWGKAGPWTDYPDRMLHWRAVGFHADDYYSDVLHGLKIAEEVRDYPQPTPPVVDVTPPPAEPDPLLEGAAAAEEPPPPEEPLAPGEMVDGDGEPPEPERDPETGEVIPDHVGRDQGAFDL